MLTRRSLFAACALPLAGATSSAQGANERILDCARSGHPLPAGDVWFAPPLRLTNIHELAGVPGRTVLRPLHPVPGPLILWTSTQPGDPATGLPTRARIRDLRILGSGTSALTGQYGIQINGAVLRLERVEIANCYLGVAVEWAVDVALRDCVLARNFCNVFVPDLPGQAVTTLRFSGCNIRLAETGVLLQRGLGVTFDDRTIIEGNTVGVQAQPMGGLRDVRCRDVWFEANGTHVVDPYRLVSVENCWME